MGEPKNDYVSIRIEDELSTIGFVTVKMDIESFGKALLGLGHVPIEFELRGINKVGKKFEHKIVEVIVSYPSSEICPREGDIDIAVSAYEVDGWLGDRKDCKNHHRQIRGGSDYTVYNVHYHRWVDVKKEENGG